jgi:hypothetical protein
MLPTGTTNLMMLQGDLTGGILLEAAASAALGLVIAYAVYRGFKYVMNRFEATEKYENQRYSNKIYIDKFATAYIVGSIRKAAKDEEIDLEEEIKNIPIAETESTGVKDALNEKTKKVLSYP